MIRSFSCDRTYAIYEGGLAAVPHDLALTAKTFLHVLSTQGLEACLLSYSCHVDGKAVIFQLSEVLSIHFTWSDGGAENVRFFPAA